MIPPLYFYNSARPQYDNETMQDMRKCYIKKYPKTSKIIYAKKTHFGIFGLLILLFAFVFFTEKKVANVALGIALLIAIFYSSLLVGCYIYQLRDKEIPAFTSLQMEIYAQS